MAKKFKQIVEETLDLIEGRMGQLAMDMDELSDSEFKSKHKRSKQEMSTALNKPLKQPKVEMDEEVELEEGQKPYVSAEAGGIGRSAAAHVLNSAGKTVKSFHKKEHGPDYMKKASAYLKKNYNKMMGEEVEQIDELSQDKLMSYRKAARKQGSGPDTGPRKAGYNLAGRKVNPGLSALMGKSPRVAATEEVQIDEISKKTLDSYSKKSFTQYMNATHGPTDWNKQSEKVRDKAAQRMKGMNMADRKMGKSPIKAKVAATNEEVEQIDELSKKTLGSYVNKAAERIGTQGVTAGLKIAADEKSSKNFKNMGKRQKGIATAVKKLTKEELGLPKKKRLKGNQHEIDANDDGKISADDFKILRNKNKARYQ